MKSKCCENKNISYRFFRVCLLPNYILHNLVRFLILMFSVADLGGASHLLSPSFFIFMQFSAKVMSNNRLASPLGLAPPLGKCWIPTGFLWDIFVQSLSKLRKTPIEMSIFWFFHKFSKQLKLIRKFKFWSKHEKYNFHVVSLFSKSLNVFYLFQSSPIFLVSTNIPLFANYSSILYHWSLSIRLYVFGCSGCNALLLADVVLSAKWYPWGHTPFHPSPAAAVPQQYQYLFEHTPVCCTSPVCTFYCKHHHHRTSGVPSTTTVNRDNISSFDWGFRRFRQIKREIICSQRRKEVSKGLLLLLLPWLLDS